MRNFWTLKWLPAPIKTEWVYHNKFLWLISFVDSNWDTVLTVQDKNMFQKNATIFYKLGDMPYSFAEYTQEINWPSSLFTGWSSSANYKYTSNAALAWYLGQQEIDIPEWYHIFDTTDIAKVRNKICTNNSYPNFINRAPSYLLDWYDNSLIYDANAEDLCYKTVYTSDRYRNPAYKNNYSWWVAPIRLAKNSVVVPMSGWKWERLWTINYKTWIQETVNITLNDQTPGISTTDSNVSITENWVQTLSWAYKRSEFQIATSLFSIPSDAISCDFSISPFKWEWCLWINQQWDHASGTDLINPSSEYTKIYVYWWVVTYTQLSFTYIVLSL